jgi:hypothetical protein
MKGMDSLHSTGHRETPRKADVIYLDSMIRNHYSATETPSDEYDQSAMTRKEGYISDVSSSERVPWVRRRPPFAVVLGYHYRSTYRATG